MKKIFIKSVIAVVAAAVAVYIAVNIIYNLPSERYPDPVQPIVHEDSFVTDTSERPLTKLETEPVTKAVTEEVTEAITEAVTEEVTEAITEAVTEEVTEELTEVVTEPITDVVTEAVTEPVSEPVAEPVTAPEDTFKQLAKKLVGDKVNEAIQLVTEARIDGSCVTYPYEKQYERELLTEEQKILYDHMVNTVSSFGELRYDEAVIGKTVIEDVKAAYDAFRLDYLQYSYYFRLAEVQTNENTVLESHYFLPSDNSVTVTDDKAALLYDIALFEAVCDHIADSMPEDFSAYDKYRYLAAVVSLCAVYDHDHESEYIHDTPYGPIMDGRAICTGYTVSFEYLCQRANLYCTRVWGATYRGLIHMWNVVKLEGGTYHVDVTWSDSDINTPCKRNWQIYFMLTQEQVLTDHVISDGTVVTGTELFG